GDEAVIATTATDGAKHNVLALFILHLEVQLDLENRAGVIFEAAHHGVVENNFAAETGPADEAENRGEFLHTGKTGFGTADKAGQGVDGGNDVFIAAALDARSGNAAFGIGDDRLDLGFGETSALGEITAL